MVHLTHASTGRPWFEIAGETEKLRAALMRHHQWHLNAGDMGICKDDDGEWIVQDMAAEYSDSTMCKQTTEALQNHLIPSDERD